MKTLSLALLATVSATLTACGSGAAVPASSNGIPSDLVGSIPKVAVASSTPTPLGRVKVTTFNAAGAPAAQKTVTLEQVDGTILSELSTASDGSVEFNAPEGAAVVVVNDQPSYHSIQAIAGVHGNMSAAFGGQASAAQTGTVTIATPAAAPGNVASYQFSIGCAETAISAGQLGAWEIALPVSAPCDAASPAALALALDANGTIVAWASASTPVSTMAAVTPKLTLGAWSTDLVSLDVTTTAAPAGTVNASVGFTLWHAGMAFDTSWTALDPAAPATTTLIVPAGFVDAYSWMASADDGATWGTWVERRRTSLPATAAIDFATDALPNFRPVMTETADTTRPVISWNALPASVDAISLDLNWYDATSGVSYESSALASTTIGSSYRMPAVPASQTAAMAPTTATFDSGSATVVDYSTPDTFESMAASPTQIATTSSEFDMRAAWAQF